MGRHTVAGARWQNLPSQVDTTAELRCGCTHRPMPRAVPHPRIRRTLRPTQSPWSAAQTPLETQNQKPGPTNCILNSPNSVQPGRLRIYCREVRNLGISDKLTIVQVGYRGRCRWVLITSKFLVRERRRQRSQQCRVFSAKKTASPPCWMPGASRARSAIHTVPRWQNARARVTPGYGMLHRCCFWMKERDDGSEGELQRQIH